MKITGTSVAKLAGLAVPSRSFLPPNPLKLQTKRYDSTDSKCSLLDSMI